MLIWNDRITDTSDLLIAYEKLLLEFSIDYKEVNHRNIDAQKIEVFFSTFNSNCKTEKLVFENYQIFDYEGLEGRLLSSSYVPLNGHKNYEPMLKELKRIFETYNDNGKVRFEYETVVYALKIN